MRYQIYEAKSVKYDAQQRVTIYCNALFDEEKNITIPKGFVAKRSKRIEWEHIVPYDFKEKN